MPTVGAKISKGIPKCSRCGERYHNGIHTIQEYGIWKKGFWFKFKCNNCSSKKSKVFVKYFTDNDFNIVKGDVNENRLMVKANSTR